MSAAGSRCRGLIRGATSSGEGPCNAKPAVPLVPGSAPPLGLGIAVCDSASAWDGAGGRPPNGWRVRQLLSQSLRRVHTSHHAR